ncbi:hypothetical protein MTX78_06240 [Hymenobacter tibetensis]|uniref:Lipoprotein n=1 Tax=Hymenobacter tibetensis TaxID=497967 RepID=A0ABY4D1H7_9BACT|nr:hypothetical protein [Hymenobacter tibetensis]UOG76192.1 hypothetical protein MTX78_06240 [Hymenobacter tibetensis]
MLLPRLLVALTLLGSLVACSESPTRRSAAVSATAPPDTAAVRKAAREFRVEYNQPQNLDSTDFYYQPVSVVPLEEERSTGSKLLSSSSYDSEYDTRPNDIEGTCYNLLFFQKSTLQEHALFPHGRFVVTEIDTDSKPDARWPYLFYTVIKADTNADGRQDEKDASALYVSDRSGRQLRQLTPDGTHLESRTLLPKTSLLLVEVRPDVNHDREFTHADGTYWLRFDLSSLDAAPVQQPIATAASALQQQMLRRQSRQTE